LNTKGGFERFVQKRIRSHRKTRLRGGDISRRDKSHRKRKNGTRFFGESRLSETYGQEEFSRKTAKCSKKRGVASKECSGLWGEKTLKRGFCSGPWLKKLIVDQKGKSSKVCGQRDKATACA